jgi:hypothetical protein
MTEVQILVAVTLATWTLMQWLVLELLVEDETINGADELKRRSVEWRTHMVRRLSWVIAVLTFLVACLTFVLFRA